MNVVFARDGMRNLWKKGECGEVGTLPEGKWPLAARHRKSLAPTGQIALYGETLQSMVKKLILTGITEMPIW